MRFASLAFFAALAAFPSLAHARLGETERELVTRFGPPSLRATHYVAAQAKMHAAGPRLYFRQEDWGIEADLTDDRCTRISYHKPGDWTEEQFQLVLAYNSQGAAWTELTKPAVKKITRNWRRTDGAEAVWNAGVGFRLVSPAYERAKQIIEAKAKAAASAKPKI